MFVRLGQYQDDGSERETHIVIHHYDTWNMDHTLALVIHPLLLQLKETKQGAPFVDDEDVPAELMAKYADEKGDMNTGQTDSNWFQRWDWVLDEMIWSFEQKLDDEGDSKFYGEWVEDETKTLGGHFAYFDNEGLKEYQSRVSNGFRLFGKYYEALWD
jgi:hypothetical protein